MRILIVVSSTKDWPIHFEGVELVTARKYLTDDSYADIPGAKVFNLCRSYRYQSVGYYVSLMAEARGQKPMPNITTIQDLKSRSIIRMVSEELDEIIQKSLMQIQSAEFALSIYFGQNLAKRHTTLSRRLFNYFQTPFLRANFMRDRRNSRWQLKGISQLDAADIPEEHRDFVIQVAKEFFARRRGPARRRSVFRYDLAILHNPEEREAPSDPHALQHFVKAAESLGLETEMIEKDDYGRLAEFDALFIRETTSVNHHTYRFARRAAAEGLVVVDDPESILKCTNKVFLAGLLERCRVPIPKTVIAHRDNLDHVSSELEFPIILKRPDSSFSQGVVMAADRDELKVLGEDLLRRSDLIIAQEFMPTEYDWRIGVFDRKPLFACKYYMVGGHWQILRRDSTGTSLDDGNSETFPVEEAPKGAVRNALRAAGLIGDGLYGVDVKQVGKKFYVIEVNDNPNIDHGVEDDVLKDRLYKNIMQVFLGRIEKKKGRQQAAHGYE